MSKTLNELKALQKEYYEAIDEAFQAKTPLGEEYFEIMRQHLFERYLTEHKQLIANAKIPDKNKDFEIKIKSDVLTPHQRGILKLFKNKTKKLKLREISAECRSEHELLTARIENLEEEFPPKKKRRLIKALKIKVGSIFKHRGKVVARTTTPKPAETELQEIIRKADETDPADVFYENNEQTTSSELAENVTPAAHSDETSPKRKRKSATSSKQIQGQLTIKDLS